MRTRPRLRPTVKEGLWVSAGQGMAAIGSLVGVRVLTGVLSPQSYGQLALGLTLSTLLGQLLFGPLGNAAIRLYAPAAESDQEAGFVGALVSLAGKASVLVAWLAVAVAVCLLAVGWLDWAAIVLASLTFGVLNGFEGLANGLQTGGRRRAAVALHEGTAPWLRFAVAAVLVVYFDGAGTAAMVGYCVATLAVVASQYRWVVRWIPFRAGEGSITSVWRADIVRFARPFAIWGLFTWGQLASGRWALAWFRDVGEVGLYTALFQVGYLPMALATSLFLQLMSPVIFAKAGSARDPDRRDRAVSAGTRLSAFALTATLAAMLVAWLAHEQIFGVFVAAEYASVSSLLPWLVLAGGLFASGQMLSLNQLSRLEPRTLIVPKVVTATAGILLSITGSIILGVEGVVWASLAFSLMYALWMLHLTMRCDSTIAERPSS